jgi:rRNA small subunit pseudouridine methyltransferase Nep1
MSDFAFPSNFAESPARNINAIGKGIALLNFVLAESALELVPKEISGRPAVVSDSKRRGTKASEILLDRSFHHSAMSRLKDSEKRGRPDLVHVALLSITGTPLYLDGGVRVFVHTYPGVVLELAEKTRIPKNYLRFRGLMEKALVERPREGLVKTYSAGVDELIRRKLGCDLVLGLSIQGRKSSADEVANRIKSAKNPCVIVGGFPHGHFSKEVLASVDELDRIDSRPLEAHVVASRVVYEIEKTVRGIND